jgi:hypothetical protein
MAKKHSLKRTKRRKHRRGGADDPAPKEDLSIYKDVGSEDEESESKPVSKPEKEEEEESESDEENKEDKDPSIYKDLGGKRRRKVSKKKSRKTRKHTKKSRKHRK